MANKLRLEQEDGSVYRLTKVDGTIFQIEVEKPDGEKFIQKYDVTKEKGSQLIKPKKKKVVKELEPAIEEVVKEPTKTKKKKVVKEEPKATEE
jgi:hypothetical protein